MLRTATYRLLRAAEVAPLDASGLGQLVLRCAPQLERNLVSPWHARPFSGAAAEEEQREITNPKVLELAEQITQLNLLEVSDLTEILRKRLNIQAPAGGMGFAFPPPGMAAPAASASGAAAPAEAAPVAEEKTEFNVKLDGFDAASKIKVIKEVRSITDLGLKEAKELVEGAPAVIKKGLKKDEAEALKVKLEAAGAKIVLE